MQAIINSKLILPHTVLTGQTLLFGTHIYDILPAGSPLPEGTESIDAKGAYLSPGFINMHIHGCGGADTMDGTRTSMEILCRKLPKCGVTAFLPTTMTRVWPIVQKALRNVRKAMEVPCPGSRVLGPIWKGPSFPAVTGDRKKPRKSKRPIWSGSALTATSSKSLSSPRKHCLPWRLSIHAAKRASSFPLVIPVQPMKKPAGPSRQGPATSPIPSTP